MARDKLTNRGPDDAGVYLAGNVALAHRRLSIIDLSPQGRQPMANEDGTLWLVFNGEIYNFRELREQLQSRGHVFASQTDSEVIVHGYEEWGTDCFEKLQGMFAIGLWDTKENRLILARDRHGKKPLFYHHAPGKSVVFASTLSPIMSWPGIPHDLNIDGIYDYLMRGYFHAPQSILKQVSKVAPGYFVTIDQNGISSKQYWNVLEVATRPKLTFKSEEDCLNQLDALLREAVRKRLVADVPIGAFLSGGVDSSLMVAMIQQVSTANIQTFSIGFMSNEFDESVYGEAVAKYLGVPNIVFKMSGNSMLNFIPNVTTVYDEPNVDFSLFPTMAVARLARSEITVALSGDGGDEFFGGYDRYLAMHYFENYFTKLPFSSRRFISNYISRFVPSQRLKRLLQLVGAPNTAAFCGSYSNVTRYINLNSLLPDYVAKRYSTDPVVEFIENLPSLSPIEAAMLYDATHGMIDGILVKVDRATMAFGVESRNPLLDTNVTEFATRLPLDLKIRGGELKYILKRLLCRYLPKKMVYRKKMGFTPPLRDWLRSELREMLTDCLSEEMIRKRGLFKPEGVQVLISQHLKHEADHSYILWALLMLEMWMQQYLDQQPLKKYNFHAHV